MKYTFILDLCIIVLYFNDISSLWVPRRHKYNIKDFFFRPDKCYPLDLTSLKESNYLKKYANYVIRKINHGRLNKKLVKTLNAIDSNREDDTLDDVIDNQWLHVILQTENTKVISLKGFQMKQFKVLDHETLLLHFHIPSKLKLAFNVTMKYEIRASNPMAYIKNFLFRNREDQRKEINMKEKISKNNLKESNFLVLTTLKDLQVKFTIKTVINTCNENKKNKHDSLRTRINKKYSRLKCHMKNGWKFLFKFLTGKLSHYALKKLIDLKIVKFEMDYKNIMIDFQEKDKSMTFKWYIAFIFNRLQNIGKGFIKNKIQEQLEMLSNDFIDIKLRPYFNQYCFEKVKEINDKNAQKENQ